MHKEVSINSIRHIEKLLLKENDEVSTYPAFDQGIDEYASLFRNFGVDFEETLKQYIGKEIIVLDIGCGTGKALQEMKSIIGPQAHYIGITAKYIPPERMPEGVAIIKSDANNLYSAIKGYLRDQSISYDSAFITSVYLARYLADPFKFLEAVYNLFPQETALIYELPIPLVKEGTDTFSSQLAHTLQRFLQPYAIKLLLGDGVYHNACVIEKDHMKQHLTIPVKPIQVIKNLKKVLFTISSRQHTHIHH